jgi:hypothetical protein
MRHEAVKNSKVKRKGLPIVLVSYQTGSISRKFHRSLPLFPEHFMNVFIMKLSPEG